ncbi:MAG: DMT family transporter [Oscillospiraceae bacterium]|nr:DMT family transporter [Oscillospiraceae bacterium]
MQKRNIRKIVLPLTAAIIWGTAFVAQSKGAEFLRCYTFNSMRGFIACAELLLACVLLRKFKPVERSAEEEKHYRKELLFGGLCCGTFLTIASNLQQTGIEFTTASKAGFITALYIVLVPILGLFFGKRVRPLIWGGVALAACGLYFLSMSGGEKFSITAGDFYVLICAFFFAGHILCIDHFVTKVDSIELSCVQFGVQGVICFVLALLFEPFDVENIIACLPFILYVSIFSSGVAYTLQIIAQKDGEDPTVVSILLSMESLFAAVSGALLLHERLTTREYFGCALMLTAVIITQLPERRKTKETC